MKLRTQLETMTQAQLMDLLNVDRSTLYRWRTDGRVIEWKGRPQLAILYTINTAGPRVKGGKILIPLNHESFSNGFLRLGASEFVDALGADPALARMEVEMLTL